MELEPTLVGSMFITDSNAEKMNQDLGAKAFTNGSDVYFNKGEYNPSSKDGQHLLAHELTHTVQQGASPSGVQKKSEDSNKEEPEVQKVDDDEKVQKQNKNDNTKGDKKTKTNPFAPTGDPFFKPFDRNKELSESQFKQENEQAIRQQLQSETGQAASEVPVKADSSKGKPTALDATNKNKKKDKAPELEVKSEEQPEIGQNEKAKEKEGASKDDKKKKEKKDTKSKEKKKSPDTIKEAPAAPEIAPIRNRSWCCCHT